MINKKDFSKFGIGTWGIGGFAERDPKNDDKKQIEALAYMFSKGINFVEINYWSAEGHGVELVSKALKESGVKREKIFISQAIYPYRLDTLKDAKDEVKKVSEMFATDCMDLVVFSKTGIDKYGYEKSLEFIEGLLSDGDVRYVGLTNADLGLLKKYHERFKEKMFSHEICFNFEIRENENLGIIGYAQKNDILNVIYQPLRRNRTAKHNYPLLLELSKKYGKTQNQIILNWIASRGFLPITKSETIKHIDEHLTAFNFEIDEEDVKRLNNFKVPGYKTPQLYWGLNGDGVRIDHLPNVFDDLVKGKQY